MSSLFKLCPGVPIIDTKASLYFQLLKFILDNYLCHFKFKTNNLSQLTQPSNTVDNQLTLQLNGLMNVKLCLIA